MLRNEGGYVVDIGHRMKDLRIQYGLTQQELADRAELTKGFISQLERNQNSPSIGTLLDIIQCLGTTPAEFFTDEEPEQIVFKNEDFFILRDYWGRKHKIHYADCTSYQYRYRHQEIIVRNRIKNFTISYLLVNCGILIAALQQHNVKREKDR